MKNSDIYWRRYKKHYTQDNDALVPFIGGTLGPLTVLPVSISCPFVFSWLPSTVVWTFSKVILVLGKVMSLRVPNLGCSGAESPGWFDITQKTALEVMHEQAHCCDEAANQPDAHSCGLLNHLNSFHGGMFKLNAKLDADSLLYSLSFWMWQPHSTHAHSMVSAAHTD